MYNFLWRFSVKTSLQTKNIRSYALKYEWHLSKVIFQRWRVKLEKLGGCVTIKASKCIPK